MYFKLIAAVVIAFVAFAATAQTPLPHKMDGWWRNAGSGHNGKVEVELLRMESPTEATIKVVWWPYCRLSETKAEFKDGAWEFTAKNCGVTSETGLSVRLFVKEGKNRLEGVYVLGGQPFTGSGRTLYLEW